MRILCPHCGAEETRCPETRRACKLRAAERRRLFALANGDELALLRAEIEQLRAELPRGRAKGALRSP